MITKILCDTPFDLLYKFRIRCVITVGIKHPHQFCRWLVHTYKQTASAMFVGATFKNKISFKLLNMLNHLIPTPQIEIANAKIYTFNT